MIIDIWYCAPSTYNVQMSSTKCGRSMDLMAVVGNRQLIQILHIYSREGTWKKLYNNATFLEYLTKR